MRIRCATQHVHIHHNAAAAVVVNEVTRSTVQQLTSHQTTTIRSCPSHRRRDCWSQNGNSQGMYQPLRYHPTMRCLTHRARGTRHSSECLRPPPSTMSLKSAWRGYVAILGHGGREWAGLCALVLPGYIPTPRVLALSKVGRIVHEHCMRHYSSLFVLEHEYTNTGL